MLNLPVTFKPARVNRVAEGRTIRLIVVDPLIKLKINEHKLELILSRISRKELLVSFVNRGSVLVDMSKAVRPIPLFKTGLSMRSSKILANVLNQHRAEEHEHGTTTN